MLFTSLSFLLFLAATLIVFAWLPRRARWFWLLLASLAFYASFGLSNIVFLFAVTFVAWAAGRLVACERPAIRKPALIAGLVLILGTLVVLKFYDFIAPRSSPFSDRSMRCPGWVSPHRWAFPSTPSWLAPT